VWDAYLSHRWTLHNVLMQVLDAVYACTHLKGH
jgi:hypothetical protein